MSLAGKGTQRLIQPDANPVTSAEKKEFIGYLKCVYWCTKEEIAQYTKFPSVVKLAKSLGCEYLDDLRVGRCVHYMSQNCIQNIVGCLGQTVLQPLLHDIQQSQLYAILIDETTDVSVKKQLIMYCRYVKGDSSTETKYIAMLPTPDGKEETNTNAVLVKAKELGLDPQKMVAMGSDGASVMLGRRSGVVAAVHTFCDVLPSLSQLSKAFQSSVIDLSVVKPLVQGTKSTIQALQNQQGDHMRNLPKYLDEHS